MQRKALTPNDFDSLAAVEERLLRFRFQEHYKGAATFSVEIYAAGPRSTS
jgi:hypothetical protein